MTMYAGITIAGQHYRMVADYAALAATERDTGLGIIAFARRLENGMLQLDELMALLRHCLHDVPDGLVKEALAGGELAGIVGAVAGLLAELLAT